MRCLFLPHMRLHKNIKIFINYFLGPLLFAWICYSIYNQLVLHAHLRTSWVEIKQSLTSVNIFYLVFVVVLMFCNWGLEAAKWKTSASLINPISFWHSFKAVLSGVSISMVTPNRVGEYIGRMMYMPEGKRLKVISITLINSMSQILVTVLMGTLGFHLLKTSLIEGKLISSVWYQFIWGVLTASLIILTLFYFALPRLEILLEKIFATSRYLYLIEAVHLFSLQRLFVLLLLSIVRYGVFVIQYILVFRLFNVAVPFDTLFWIMSLVFLTLALIPSITLVEVGIRGEVSLQLVGLFTSNSLGILLTSVSVWFVNLIIPAMAGSILILSLKIFKRNHKAESAEVEKYYSDEMV